MEILYILVPLSVVLVFVIGAIFWWSLKSGQFEDLEGPAYRILMDDDRARPEEAREPGEPGEPEVAPKHQAQNGAENSNS